METTIIILGAYKTTVQKWIADFLREQGVMVFTNPEEHTLTIQYPLSTSPTLPPFPYKKL